MPYFHPIDHEQDVEIREELVKLVRERSKANFDWLQDNMPGLEKSSGRERLAFYRETDDLYWEELAATYPDLARAALMDWAQLSKRYPMFQPAVSYAP